MNGPCSVARPLLTGLLCLALAGALVTGFVPSTANGAETVVVGVLSPFTGADAVLGAAHFAACFPAARQINAAGGVLGRQVACKQFDTRGEPADAVPAARQMVASTPNLFMTIGVSSDEASSVMPILDENHVPTFSQTGQSEFNQSKFTYFYRLVPADEYDAYAMVGIAVYLKHYKRIALVFGNDIGSQTFVGPAIRAIKKVGAQMVINQAIALNQSSYRTEVTKLLAAKPDVILTEALGPADAIYLSEVKQLNGGMIPVIGSSATIDPVWFKAVSAAIGVPDLLKYFLANDTPSTFNGPGYDAFRTNLIASASQYPAAPKYAKRGSTIHLYDGIVMTALAAAAAKSTDRTVFQPWIVKIGDGAPGATVVATYAQGLAALKKGLTIRYDGAGGPTHFDQWHNSNNGFVVVRYNEKGDEVQVGTLTNAQITTLSTP
ncbi:MAG TPA: ABC transporter substrate-binding protein [bacterium]|nr:ABC transporter substrate-binding protein [bacterium]